MAIKIGRRRPMGATAICVLISVVIFVGWSPYLD